MMMRLLTLNNLFIEFIHSPEPVTPGYHTAQMLARCWGFLGSGNLVVSVKLSSDDSCCHGNENYPAYTFESGYDSLNA